MNRYEKAFIAFHELNPKVYVIFKRFAFKAMAKGATVMGVDTVWGRMRWYSQVESQGEEFKLNNNHRTYYARMFMRDYPQHKGFFVTRAVNVEAEDLTAPLFP